MPSKKSSGLGKDSNLTTILALSLIIFVAGFIIYRKRLADYAAYQRLLSILQASRTETVVLREQNDSGESGTASFYQTEGNLRVTLKVDGAPANVSQPAHVHSGTCNDLGEIVYPLTNVDNGNSVTRLNATLNQLRAEAPLAVNVHMSVSELDEYVACGNLPY